MACTDGITICPSLCSSVSGRVIMCDCVITIPSDSSISSVDISNELFIVFELGLVFFLVISF